jgi:hypothetical protein
MAHTVTTTQGHKLTQNMVTAILSADYSESDAQREGHTGYVIHTMDGRTRKALHNRGLMHGHYYLTQEGMNTLAELSGNDVDTEFPAQGENVTVQGEYVEADDAFLHMGQQEYAARIADGGCVGLCAVGMGCKHCDTQYGRNEPETDAESLCTATDDNPDCLHCERVAMDEMDNREMMAEFMRAGNDVQEESAVQNIETVMVIQNIAGTNGMNHYHAPECRDIQREQRKYGQRKGDAFSAAFPSVAAILSREYSDVCNGEAEEMVAEANSEDFGVKIMPCLSIPKGELDGRPVEFVNGEWRLGIALDTVEFTEEQISTRTAQETYPTGSLVMVKEDSETLTRVGADYGHVIGHGARPFTSAPGTRPWWIPTVMIKREDGSTRHLMVGDVQPYGFESDPGDAGFAETDSVELAEWEKDLIQATETSISTGTTRHSMTSDGKQWESFQHVLNAGDIVRVAGMQGVYEVHCLIPGLPTVYVLGTTGEPFPVSATATYAI